MQKSIVLVIILIFAASSLILIKETLAQTSPSVPEFSLGYVDNSFVVPSTTTSTPALIVNLAESASALNYGNKINFTVTVDGRRAPYTYAWYEDNNLVDTSNSPYYSTNTLGVGSHHVYVQITDADNNVAQTLAVSFEVLPSLSPSFSPSPSVPEFPSWIILTLTMTALLLGVIGSKIRRNSNIDLQQ
jgi:hypothetical protein